MNIVLDNLWLLSRLNNTPFSGKREKTTEKSCIINSILIPGIINTGRAVIHNICHVNFMDSLFLVWHFYLIRFMALTLIKFNLSKFTVFVLLFRLWLKLCVVLGGWGVSEFIRPDEMEFFEMNLYYVALLMTMYKMSTQM